MARLFESPSIQYGQATGAATTAAPFTMAAWVRPIITNNIWTALSVGHASIANVYVAVGLLADNRSFVEVSGALANGPSSPIATDGQWCHIAATGSSATNRVAYLNGVAGTANTTNSTFSSADVTTVGALNFGGGIVSLADAVIAEVAIWNVALSTVEITALARGIHPFQVRPVAIVFYVPLWGTSSPERDYTRNGRHLTLTNGPTVAGHAPVRPMPPEQMWVPPTAAATASVMPIVNLARDSS